MERADPMGRRWNLGWMGILCWAMRVEGTGRMMPGVVLVFRPEVVAGSKDPQRG